jgi:hypothetical protein
MSQQRTLAFEMNAAQYELSVTIWFVGKAMNIKPLTNSYTHRHR